MQDHVELQIDINTHQSNLNGHDTGANLTSDENDAAREYSASGNILVSMIISNVLQFSVFTMKRHTGAVVVSQVCLNTNHFDGTSTYAEGLPLPS